MTPEEALAYGRAMGERGIEVMLEDDSNLLALAECVDKLYDQLVEREVPAISVSATIVQLVAYRTTARVAGVESSQP